MDPADEDGPPEISLTELRALEDKPFKFPENVEIPPEMKAYWDKKLALRRAVGDWWVQKNAFIDPWKPHALGVAALHWTNCENAVVELFAVITNRSLSEARPILEKENDIGKQMDRVITAAKQRGYSDHILKLIHAAKAALLVCRDNRNALIHTGFRQTHDEWGLGFSYRKRKESEGRPIQDDLDTIRRVADEIDKVRLELSSLWMGMLKSRATAEAWLHDHQAIVAPEKL